MTTDLLSSHARRSQVPKLTGLRVGTCCACGLWALFPKRYRKCWNCQPTRNGKAGYAIAVAAVERANVKPVKTVKPKDQTVVGAYSLGRAMAMVKALSIDYPNLKACDLKPEYQDLWPA
jgi:hypothetical protein